MGKKKKSKGPAMVKFEHIVKDMVVVLKRDQHCKVRWMSTHWPCHAHGLVRSIRVLGSAPTRGCN